MVQVQVFYDGDCPLCMREVRMLRRRDREARIRFTDIAAPEFDAVAYGTTYAELMAKLRGRLPDGTWIDGVEVFRRMYTAIGWHRLVTVTRVLEFAYARFAANRLRLTGRCEVGASARGARCAS
ncbi:MAG: DUF393 domain-containing protein [Kofleriaceae bacterium]